MKRERVHLDDNFDKENNQNSEKNTENTQEINTGKLQTPDSANDIVFQPGNNEVQEVSGYEDQDMDTSGYILTPSNTQAEDGTEPVYGKVTDDDYMFDSRRIVFDEEGNDMMDVNQAAPENNAGSHTGEEQEEYIDVNNMSGDAFMEAEKTENKKQGKPNKALVGIIAGVAALLLIAGGVCYAVFFGGDSLLGGIASNDQTDSTVQEMTYQSTDTEQKPEEAFMLAKGITVSGIDIGGKTIAEARQLLEEKQLSLRQKLDIQVVANNKSAQLTEDSFEYIYNTEDILEQAASYTKMLAAYGINNVADSTDKTGGTYELTCKLDEASIDSAVEKIANKMDVKVKQARVTSFKPQTENKFEYAPGEKGYKVSQDTLKNDLVIFLEAGKTSGTINAKVTEVEPTITVDMVKKNIVPLSTHSTTSSNTEDGTHNMRTALGACNGSVIEPGGVWSFNNCTGDSNLTSNGYRAATVIMGGKYEQGIGGGICQASTTIYMAALYADMGIYERYNHFWASSYAAAGLDATIDYPYLDLKLQNNTEYQMFLECYMSGRNLIVNIYGYKDPSYDKIATYSTTHSITSESFKATAYRIYYKNGSEVRREELSTSTYSLTDNHYVVAGDSGTFGRLPGDSSSTKVEPTTPAATQKPTQAATQPTTAKPTQPTTAKPTTKPTQPTTAKPTQPTTTPTTIPPTTDPVDETDTTGRAG